MTACPNTAILLTPRPSAGGSAIAVIRLRGPRVGEFLRRFFSRAPIVGQCVHGILRDGQTTIDDAILVAADDWADLCLHGGAWVVESALKLAEREGFALIKSDLPLNAEALDGTSALEREVLQYLPQALTEPAIRMLLNQPAAWRTISSVAFDPVAIMKDQTLWRLLHAPKIAIIGRPNVGKSTLANRLYGQQRSITADIPGTTRDWVGEMANISGLPAILIDTPGQRRTDDAIESAAIAASREKINGADLLIVLLEAPGARPDPIPLKTPRQIIAINKIDQTLGWDISSIEAVRISAKTGQGCNELIRAIHERLGIETMETNCPRWWTQRQREILSTAGADAVKLIVG